MRLNNKRAVVTGGAGGIGRAIVELFLREGAQVYVLDRNADELAALEKDSTIAAAAKGRAVSGVTGAATAGMAIGRGRLAAASAADPGRQAAAAEADEEGAASGRQGAAADADEERTPSARSCADAAGGTDRLRTFVCDISDESAIQSAAEQIERDWGGLDILVNNAGIATRESFLDIPVDGWDRIMNVNVRGMFLLSQWAARTMVDQGSGGAIVNMSSKNGLAGSTYLAHYNASKGAVELLTRSMAAELAPYQIRVNAVAPGFIDTTINGGLKKDGEAALDLSELATRPPMKRLGTAEEVAHVFLFLASEEASYVTGATIVVDGGQLANASDF